jgi:ABC-type molybdate transport system substrate-binding protein
VVKLDYQRFKTVNPVFVGLPIGYGITIANNSRQKAAAIKFLQFLMGPEGQKICTQDHLPTLIPPYCDNINALPDELKPLFK